MARMFDDIKELLLILLGDNHIVIVYIFKVLIWQVKWIWCLGFILDHPRKGGKSKDDAWNKTGTILRTVKVEWWYMVLVYLVTIFIYVQNFSW